MKNGFRIPPQPSKKEAMNNLETEVANLQMAGRISQMMMQQIMQNMKNMEKDLGDTMNQFFELQYKFGAIKELLNLDSTQLDAIANKHRLVDFESASVKADVKENLVPAVEVSEDSTVTISTTAVDDKGIDAGIFRSRLKLSECGVPGLIAELQGKQVGAKVVSKLNGLDHTVELLDIRNPSPEAKTVVAEVVV